MPGTQGSRPPAAQSASGKSVLRTKPFEYTVVISPVHHPVDQGENWLKLRQELIGLAFHGPHWGSSPPRRSNFNKDQRSARAFQPQFPSRATIILSNERARAQSNNGQVKVYMSSGKMKPPLYWRPRLHPPLASE